MNIYYKKGEKESLRDGLDFLFTDFASSYNNLEASNLVCSKIYKNFHKEYPSLKKTNNVHKMLSRLFSNFVSNETTLIAFWYIKEFQVKHPDSARDLIDLDVFCTHLKVLHFILGGKEMNVNKEYEYEEYLTDYWTYLKSKMTYTV